MGNNAVKKAGKGVLRTLLVIFTAVLLFAAFLVAVVAVLLRGPSTEARRIFTLSCNETSAMKFVPRLFLDDETVDEIISVQSETVEVEDTSIPYENGEEAEEVVVSVDETAPGVEVIDIVGSTYKGKMMIVTDPSRVFIGTLDEYGYDKTGLYLYEFVEKYDALGGINAGGFYDVDGHGTGGVPDGIVIEDGAIKFGNAESWYTNYIGFDGDGVLHVGTGSGQDMLDLGIVTGTSFPPGKSLIIDGVVQEDLGGGLNPRTAIGQRADGTVLLLVIEGRHPGSLGASYDDLAKELYEHGAVNAGMLDGGSSSAMYYEGEQITRGSNLIGMRNLATCILVSKEDAE